MNNKILSKTAISIVFVLFFCLVFFNSCQKDDSNKNYNSSFVDSFNIISINNPEDAITRIRFLQDYYFHTWGMELIIPDLMSWEYVDYSYEFQDFGNIQLSPITRYLDYFWLERYKSINLCNIFLSEMSGLNSPDMNYNKGKVYFYRAYAYFNLIRNFGKFYPDKNINAQGVPIITSSNAEIQRASVKQVYDYIIADLDSAANLLPEPIGDERINKYAALAVAAKTHIWFQDYDKAELLLNEIIQSNKFSLQTNFGDNFNGLSENGPESIYEIQYYEDGQNWYSPGFIPRSQYSYFITQHSRPLTVSDVMVSKFGDDKRAKETFYSLGDTMYQAGTVVINEDGKRFIKKYAHVKSDSSNFMYGINILMIRLADIYLLYSETQILKSNLAGALQYINLVRARAGNNIIELNGMSADQLLEILSQERFLELCGEGEYWYDLIRWNKVEEVTNSRYCNFIHGVNEAFPIPQVIIDNNPGILQNPGYY